MKYATMITFIICISLIANVSHSFNLDPAKYDITCSDNGAITLDAPDNIDASSSYRVAVTARDIDNTTFDVKGTWKGGIFTSEEAQFNNSGEYTILVTFVSRDIVEKTTKCPGLAFSCRIFSAAISRCYNHEGSFYALYELKNKGTYDWDPKTNMTYSAGDDNGRTIELNPSSKQYKIDVSSTGQNTYKLEWLTERNIELFHLRVPLCKTTVSRICTEPVFCKEDSDCLEFENCDGYCKKLNCSEGEYILNHKCLAYCSTDRECDDGLVCTKDRCTGSACIHEPVKCTTQEKCTIAECKEPKGCIYLTDEKCQKLESEPTPEKNEPKTPASQQQQIEEEPESSNDTGNCTATISFLLLIILILVIYIIKKPELKQAHEPRRRK